MISIADLNDLCANPQVAYPEYRELLAEAHRRSNRAIDPAMIAAYAAVIRDRGPDWCSSVLGFPMPAGGLRQISCTCAELLLLAHERDMAPPLPGWLAQWKAESAEMAAAQEEGRRAAMQRDRDRWAAALAACAVEVTVRPNVHGRRYNTVLAGPLRHVVPLADAWSGRSRRHPAGRALCETERRHKPLVLGEPTGEPATCVSCIGYTARIRAEMP